MCAKQQTSNQHNLPHVIKTIQQTEGNPGRKKIWKTFTGSDVIT